MAINCLKATARPQRGFSLIELVISLAILTIVIGVVLSGIDTMQARNAVEANKVDLTQESREFMDQISNDLRQSGFPRSDMFDRASLNPAPTVGAPPDCTQYANIACGLLNISSTAVQFEGDVDGSGVSEEWIQLVQNNGSNAPCTTPPCVLQRGTIAKSPACVPYTSAACTTTYYTEVNGVMNTNIFTAYDNNGNDLSGLFPINNIQAQGSYNGYTNGFNIRAVGITLYVRASQPDPKTGVFPTVTMVSSARVND